MEVLTKILSAKVRDSQIFKFHPHCERQQITHQIFADDLMIFVAADIQSIKLIKNALEEFKGLSGLSINESKSEVFCAAVPDALMSYVSDSFYRLELGVYQLGIWGCLLLLESLPIMTVFP